MEEGTVNYLCGDKIREAFSRAALALERDMETINALNVFPVPDGDTGTNMVLTMKAVNEEASRNPHRSAGEVIQAMARGALLGARGNSGVILSQFFQGLAKATKGMESLDGRALAQALKEGAQAAYKAVSRPVEGTILTVIREAALAAQEKAALLSADVLAVLEAAWMAACKAVKETPSLLPVLRQAGVVDAGGQGMAILLGGMVSSLRGVELETAPIQPVTMAVREEFLTATEEELYGYCTQFLLKGEDLDPELLREKLSALADSTVVVGDGSLLKVHCHALDPGPILSCAVAMGTLSQVKIDNIDEQHQEFLYAQRQRQLAPLGVVAVSWGRGLDQVFTHLGIGVVSCGRAMNPSTQELLEAVRNTPAEQVILLPNNANVIPVAEQAVSLSPRPLHVVPTRTIPQGVAAALAFNPEAGLDTNLSAMNQALTTVRSGEVTVAVRSAEIQGFSVTEGQFLGFLDGYPVAVGDDRLQVLKGLLREAPAGPGSLLTLYWGEELGEETARREAAYLQESFPGLQVEVVYGGQPHYHYILSVE